MHRAAHHLLDDLHVAAELLALDEVDLELAAGALVDELREHGVRAVDDAADRVRAAEDQGLLSLRNCRRNKGDRGQEAGQEPSHVFLPRAASFPCAMGSMPPHACRPGMTALTSQPTFAFPLVNRICSGGAFPGEDEWRGSASRRRQRGRVRIEDVAELAGVSAITVSRVLRTPAVVAEATRRRVEQAVDRLGYVPNLAAGTLASLKSRLVAVIVPTLRSSVYADTIQGLSDELSTAGYHLMVGYSGYSADLEMSVLTAFMGRQPDAVVLTGVEHIRRCGGCCANVKCRRWRSGTSRTNRSTCGGLRQCGSWRMCRGAPGEGGRAPPGRLGQRSGA